MQVKTVTFPRDPETGLIQVEARVKGMGGTVLSIQRQANQWKVVYKTK